MAFWITQKKDKKGNTYYSPYGLYDKDIELTEDERRFVNKVIVILSILLFILIAIYIYLFV